MTLARPSIHDLLLPGPSPKSAGYQALAVRLAQQLTVR